MDLLVADKAWDSEGQLLFNVFNLDGFIGDRILTHWFYRPYFHVRARRYRSGGSRWEDGCDEGGW